MITETGIRALAEAARAFRHGNCSEQDLIDIVDAFEARMSDGSVDLTEGKR